MCYSRNIRQFDCVCVYICVLPSANSRASEVPPFIPELVLPGLRVDWHDPIARVIINRVFITAAAEMGLFCSARLFFPSFSCLFLYRRRCCEARTREHRQYYITSCLCIKPRLDGFRSTFYYQHSSFRISNSIIQFSSDTRPQTFPRSSAGIICTRS